MDIFYKPIERIDNNILQKILKVLWHWSRNLQYFLKVPWPMSKPFS